MKSQSQEKIQRTHSKLYWLIYRSVRGDGLSQEVAISAGVGKDSVADLVLSGVTRLVRVIDDEGAVCQLYY